jgi:hypothetical protein
MPRTDVGSLVRGEPEAPPDLFYDSTPDSWQHQAPTPSLWERFIDHDPKLIRNMIVLALVVLVVILSQWSRPTEKDHGSVPQPTATADPPARSRWQTFRHFDFSSNDGGWVDTGVVASRDSGRSRPRQARFGTGPEGKWLTVVAERASAASPVYAIDLKGEAYAFPNYFAIELDYQLPTLGPGMWPAPLWLRPLETSADPRPEGEIDVMEWFGRHFGTRDEAGVTAHKTPYDAGHRLLNVATPQLGGAARNLEHHIRLEKVPGLMTWWIDGRKAVTMTRAAFDARAGAGSWDAMFENKRRLWYPRITYQVGPGTAMNLAGDIPDKWRRSEMHIKRLDVFELSAATAAPAASPARPPSASSAG